MRRDGKDGGNGGHVTDYYYCFYLLFYLLITGIIHPLLHEGQAGYRLKTFSAN